MAGPEMSPLLQRAATGLVIATLVLLVAGAQVTSTESGDAVDQWPLPLHVPKFGGGEFWELGHRAIAGLTALLTAFVTFLAFRDRSASASRARKIAAAALGLVLAQALLGGVRVLVGASDPNKSTPEESGLIRAIAIFHACTAQAFWLVVLSLWDATRRRTVASAPSHQAVRRIAVVASLACYAQVVLGAILRHTMTGTALLVHLGGALIVLLLVVKAASAALSEDDAEIRGPAKAAGHFLLAQIALGLGAYLLLDRTTVRSAEVSWHALLPSLHLVVGALLLGSVWTLALRAGATRSHAPHGVRPGSGEALGGICP